MGRIALLRRLLSALRRIRQTPDFAEEGWVRDWESKRVLRLERRDDHIVAAAGADFDTVDAASTLPPSDTDALDEPPGVERAVCAEDPRCTLFVRGDGAVYPCSVLAAREGVASLGRLPDDAVASIWEHDVARRFRRLFADRTRTRDALFFQRIGGTRTLYDRSIREAGEDLPSPPAECRGCPSLGGNAQKRGTSNKA